MPFIIRKIEPHYIGRGHMPQDTTSVKVWPIGTELGAITNGALASTLKQLASLLSNAEDIFHGLTIELTDLANRSGILCSRIDLLNDNLSSKDPKKTPVPESDISTFAARKVHFESKQTPTTGLFASVTRPKAINELYEAAVEIAIRSLDSLRRERDGSAIDMYMCTPILGKRRRPEQSLEIESRVPAILDDLRKWTSSEALGDVTVPPDSLSRIIQEDDDAVDHKLPSPEEQVQAIALKFPAEIVAVDVSGRGFARMSMRRKSLLTHQTNETSDNHDAIGVVKRRSRTRRPRSNRRNTLAGTDSEEIKRAINIEIESAINNIETDEHLSNVKRTMPKLSGRVFLSTSTDTLGGKSVGTFDAKWNFDALKAWGRSRLKRNNSKMEMTNRRSDKTSCKLYGNDLYDSINDQEMRLKSGQCQGSKKNRSNERKQSLSSLSGKSCSSTVLSSNIIDNQTDIDGVILRESAAQKRERRKGNNNREDPLHSSSGNWSASSESGRASIGSETTTSTTHPNRSTSTTSASTCSTRMTQNYMKRFRCRDTSTSSSITSEGTLTPDIIHDIGPIPFSEETEGEGETCSVYSCDTEGYYTSFHMDSGLKTLREEELTTTALVQQNPLIKSNVVNPHIGENEYELFGRGSTSTTTSSAGTVCTALMAPLPPERKSSLTVVAMVHKQSKNGGVSPDSGHNTSSSPVESTSSPACCTTQSLSELEFSESSDLEGCDRIERIRSKTAISTSRIPSMCVITPPGSDDEQQRQQQDSPGAVLMSATVGTSQMKVINGDDKNLYATVQRIVPKSKLMSENIPESLLVKVDSMNVTNNVKIKPFSGVLGKLRSVLPSASTKNSMKNVDSGDYVTIADMRNNNDKYRDGNPNLNTYANKYLILQQQQQQQQQQQNESEYVSLNELPMKADSSLERKRHGARVTLDSDGKVIYTSDSLKRRREAHTTFNPGPFVKETLLSSSMLARSPTPHRSIIKTSMPNSQSIGQNDNSNANKSLAIRVNKTVQEQRDDGIEREQEKIHSVYNNAESQEGKGMMDPCTERSCTDSTNEKSTKNNLSLTINDTIQCITHSPSPIVCNINNHNNANDLDDRSSMLINFNKVKHYPEDICARDIASKLTSKISDSPRNVQSNNERKIKRSESYRMANSPLMFIKKISANYIEKSDNGICRTASEELREDLFKERINYPESVANTSVINNSSTNNLHSCQSNNNCLLISHAREKSSASTVKYSNNDTEIW
ncbi:hypothetical protein PV327_009871 [Microctonus hyperodae]|uniref:WASP family protein member n=1 Tax=Microctonus hyperodae TaxID=165561 RepID=A0AA39KG71_MICHY|nr:hypothetical protein PV327_009871 [Microctonus hyperodae]